MNKLSLSLLNAQVGSVLGILESTSDNTESMKVTLNERIKDKKGIEDVNAVLDNMSAKLKIATTDFKSIISVINELNSVLQQFIELVEKDKKGEGEKVEKEKEVVDSDLKSMD